MQKLLLADDSVTIQRVIELTFSGEDIQVVAVNDGEQAIARIPVERPDIVLADIGMPKKGGYDVAAFVKGRPDLEHIPVLLLAGAFEPVDQARAEQVRCDGVLIKPFEPRQVIERVRELLDGVKGSPAQATADVPRPVERLAPRIDPQPIIEVSPVIVAAAHIAVVAVPAVEMPPVEAPQIPSVVAAPAALPPLDDNTSLDDYFESLNVAFSSVGDAPRPEHETPVFPPLVVEPPIAVPPVVATAPVVIDVEPVEAPRAPVPADPFNLPEQSFARAPRRHGDSLDDYFDRLSSAFEQVKPAAPIPGLPDGFDELMGDVRVPTVDALVPSSDDDFGFTLPPVSSPPRPTPHGSEPPASWLSPDNPSAVALAEPPARAVRNPIVEALEAMLAVPDPGLSGGAAAPEAEAPAVETLGLRASALSSDLVETVTQRVLERLAPEIATQLQRLVQEEIERATRP